jgi:serine/threonine protein phosphatase 1
MRRFAVGDIHGAYKALKEVLIASNFNYDTDKLISVGDTADGWPDVSECFDELLKIKNLVYVMGNHDDWLRNWFNFNSTLPIWTSQGGNATLKNYRDRIKEEGAEFIEPHKKLLDEAPYYYITEDNKCFIHGGYNWHYDIADQSGYDLSWNRHLFATACMWQEWNEKDKPLIIAKHFDEVFIGHTSTCRSHPDMLPVHVSNVWNIDQGAGWEGKLTLIDIDTHEYWQSTLVKKLYPYIKGR